MKRSWRIVEISIEIPSLLGEEKKVIKQLEIMLQHTPFAESDCMDIETAAAEACLNAMQHGNRLDPKLSVNIHIQVTDNKVTVEVYDHGEGAELQALIHTNALNSEKTGGWGLHLINMLTDEWEYFYKPDEKLFCVRMNKYISEGR
jgi:serine/threonine-protein kinase RsbW